MQITSANPGSYSSSGPLSSIGSAVQLTARNPDAGTSSNTNIAVSAASNARSLQQVVPPITPTNSETSRTLLLARQREGFGVLAGIVPVSQSGREAAAQRAVAEYSTVAAQEQRFELDDVLARIDVFA